MSEVLRLCLFNASGEQNTPFRNPFAQLTNSEILTEARDWEELANWLKLANVDLVAINLDDGKGLGLRAIQRTADLAPTCGILGVSKDTSVSTIITAMREGCHQFVPWPIDPDDLRNAIERIRATRQVNRGASKRFCIIGSSGGVGATMIACNLAIELAHLTTRKCAMVDLNLEFGDVSCTFDCTPTFSVSDVCKDGVEVDRLMLGKAVEDLPCDVSILARPEKLEEAREVTPDGVRNMLRVMEQMFPYTVVDIPRAFSFLSAAAVAEANGILLVTQLSVPCIRNASRIFNCLEQMGADTDCVEIVLNRYKAHHSSLTPDEIESHFGKPIFALIPNDFRRIQASLDLGHPVMADAPNSPARIAIQEMARKLLNEQSGNKLLGRSNQGFFGKLWKRGSERVSR